jgi:hypothetical protein
VELIDEDERKMDVQDTQALMEAMASDKKASKVSKPAIKGKPKTKDGKEKTTLDAETEAEIKKQLDDLQLDLE